MLLSYFSVERRQERLEDRLEDERGRLSHARRFHHAFGKRASEVRMYERRVARREVRLARFLAKHDLQQEGEHRG
jgi:hypothetical protein